MRVASFAVLAVVACTEKPATEADDRLRAAIAEGHWPEKAPLAAHGGDPLALGDDALLAALGHHRYEAEATFSYTGEDGEEGAVHEKTTLTVAKDGRYHLVVDRDFRRVDGPPGTSGREGVWDGERFVTRLRHGKWMVHDPLRREHEPWRSEAALHLATVVRLVGKSLVRTKDGRKIGLSLGQWRRPVLPKGTTEDEARHHEGDLWYSWWKRVHRATAFTGSATLADAKDVVVAADVSLTATVSKERSPRVVLSAPETTATPGLFGGRSLDAPPAVEAPATPPAPEAPHAAQATLDVKVTVRVTALPEAPAIEPPPDAEVRAAKRKRVQHMVESILGETAP